MMFIPYCYVVVSPALTGNGSGIQTLVLDQDADFELHYLLGASSLDVNTNYRPNNFSVQITDKSSSRFWSSARVPQVHLGVNPGELRLIRPVLLARRTNLQFDFLNLSGSANTVTITMIGSKVVQ